MPNINPNPSYLDDNIDDTMPTGLNGRIMGDMRVRLSKTIDTLKSLKKEDKYIFTEDANFLLMMLEQNLFFFYPSKEFDCVPLELVGAAVLFANKKDAMLASMLHYHHHHPVWYPVGTIGTISTNAQVRNKFLTSNKVHFGHGTGLDSYDGYVLGFVRGFLNNNIENPYEEYSNASQFFDEGIEDGKDLLEALRESNTSIFVANDKPLEVNDHGTESEEKENRF